MYVESESFLINYKENFEIIFCLALIEHLYNKEQFIRKLASLCSGILFLEGNSTTDIDSLKRILILAGFHDVHFIGKSDDEKNESNNNRPLLICKK
jgi:2-polyprenyl-3-methyl-5-hydroxy-6-metoxy-1,4-benzoquinol methylase